MQHYWHMPEHFPHVADWQLDALVLISTGIQQGGLAGGA